MSHRNHRVSNSPGDQHRNVQPCQGIAQVDELLAIIERGIGGCHKRFVRARLSALLVELVYQFLLDHTSMSEEVCEFHAYVLRAGLGMYQLEHRAINLRPQARAIDQYQSFYPLRIASGEGKSHCSSERVANNAHALPIWTKSIEEACQELGQRWHAVICSWLGAATCAHEIKRADAELFGKGWQIQRPGGQRAAQSMHKHHVWCVDRSGHKAVDRYTTNVNVPLLGLFRRRRFRFLGCTQHILAPDHSTGSRSSDYCQVNAKFLREPSRRWRSIHPSAGAARCSNRCACSACRFPGRCLPLAGQHLSLLPLDLGILAYQISHLFIGQFLARHDNHSKSCPYWRILPLRYSQPAHHARCRRFHLVRSLLALDLHNGLALLDRVARTFQPFDNEPRLHRQSPLGHA